jgi:ABC-type polar amino acid transport system ATPase subunit
VTHELASIETIADRIIMLDKDAQGIIAARQSRRIKGSEKKTQKLMNFLTESVRARHDQKKIIIFV